MKQDELNINVLSKLDSLITEVKALRSDTSSTKADLKMINLRLRINETHTKAMQTDLGDIKTDVAILKKDVGELKYNVRRLEVLHEETDDTIKSIFEELVPNNIMLAEIKKHQAQQDETIEFHENRIGFLEKKIA